MVAGVCRAKGWVETIPWCGRGFWSTIGGGPNGVGFGGANTFALGSH